MRTRLGLVSGIVLVGCFAAVARGESSDTSISYQGQVRQAGQPVDGPVDFRYRLYDASESGSQVGPTVAVNGVGVADGLFTVQLDFGPESYATDSTRWLEIDIRSPAGSGNFVTLVPRQPLTAVPVSLSTRGLDVDVSGNVGIGTSNPEARLDVLGTARMTGFQLLTPGVVEGSVLTADANGNGNWLPPACITLPCTASTGAGGCALSITNTSPGNAICGHATAGAGNNYGVYGTAGSLTGAGVAGSAVTGVLGTSSAANGTGIAGSASGTTDAWGVSGETATGQAVIGRAGTGLPGGGFAGGTGVLGFSNVAGGFGMWAESADAGGIGLLATNTSSVGAGVGLRSYSSSNTGVGAHGLNVAPSGNTLGVWGETYSTSGIGVYGSGTATSGNSNGVWGHSLSPSGTGVIGANVAGSGLAAGVHGFSSSTTGGAGVVGSNFMPSGQTYGVYGETYSTSGFGVYGTNSGSLGVGVYGYSPLSTGVVGVSDGTGGIGVYGGADAASGTTYAIYGSAVSSTGYAGYFNGRVNVNGDLDVAGNLSKGGGTFKIDHPLDPENKYLYHSFVESPDMKNIYDGLATTDAQGYATVTMPEWFDALNRDFRYQLTVIDSANSDDFVQAKVVRELSGNQFTVRTSRPHVTVSWQVTGIRQDAFANAHRVQVEVDKSQDERGRYLYPTEHGQPIDRGIEFPRTRNDVGCAPAEERPSGVAPPVQD